MHAQQTMNQQLTIKQKRFADEYLRDLNGRQAAIRAGYNPKSAKEQASRLLTNVNLKVYLSAELSRLSLSAEETVKALSDIARASLNDYFTLVDKEFTPMIKVSVKQIIEDLKAQIQDFEKYITVAKDISDTELKEIRNEQAVKQRQIVRLEIECERNPNAYRIIPGETVMIKEAKLDLARLALDKEAGRIKAFKLTEHGYSIEFYPADNALRDLARIHGLFKDNLTVDAGESFFEYLKKSSII